MATRAARAAAGDKAAAGFGCGLSSRCVLLTLAALCVLGFGVLLLGATRARARYSPFHRHPAAAAAAASAAASSSGDGGIHLPVVQPVRASLLAAVGSAAAAGARPTAASSPTHAPAPAPSPASAAARRASIAQSLASSAQRVAAMQAQVAAVRVNGATVVPPAAASAASSASAASLSPTGHADAVKLAAVRGAIKHAWDGYAARCFGQDELNAVTGACENWLNQGNTLIDSLDTLWIAGLKDEFKRARDWVAAQASTVFSRAVSVSFFESTIRVLGGLLSAYHLRCARDEQSECNKSAP
jgi:hypothetical protein